jgi:hypothetical protein
MLRFFIASRLAGGRDLFFDIACSKYKEKGSTIKAFFNFEISPVH